MSIPLNLIKILSVASKITRAIPGIFLSATVWLKAFLYWAEEAELQLLLHLHKKLLPLGLFKL